MVWMALAFGITAVATPLVRAAALRFGLLDRPNPRSSHKRITARGGGAAIVLATLVCLLANPAAWAHRLDTICLAAGALTLALVGLGDDRFGLSPLTRIGFQAAAALGIALSTAGLPRLPLPPPLDLPLGPLGTPVAVLWIVAVVNFYNFLDGIDGLGALQGLVTGLGLALASWDPLAVLMGAALAGGCGAFLLFNWSPATIFLGDVGSGFLGFAFAALPLLVPGAARPSAVLFVALSLWLFLADASWTLLRRAARGERLYRAHREHLYQRLVAAGCSHASVAAAIGLGSSLLTAVALAVWRTGDPLWAWAGLACGLVLFGLEAATARVRTAR